MESKRRRELGLGAVAIVLLAVAVWTMQPTANQPVATATNAAASVNAAAGKSPLADIDLEVLETRTAAAGRLDEKPVRLPAEASAGAMPAAARHRSAAG